MAEHRTKSVADKNALLRGQVQRNRVGGVAWRVDDLQGVLLGRILIVQVDEVALGQPARHLEILDAAVVGHAERVDLAVLAELLEEESGWEAAAAPD